MKKLLALTLAGLVLFTGCGKKENPKDTPNQGGNGTVEEGPQVNVNENVVGDKEVEEFTFTNGSVIYEDGNTLYEVTVTNTSSKDAYLKQFLIHFYDAEGNEISTLMGFVGSTIPAGESKVISAGTSTDLSKAKDTKVEVVR